MYVRLAPLLLLLGCAVTPSDSSPPPDWIVGKYQYSGSGTLAGKFPWQAKSDLLLDRDGQYTLGITVYILHEAAVPDPVFVKAD
ncbi:MAG: hypothetical protein ACT4O1_12720 [Gemmatimonadota bacterium]